MKQDILLTPNSDDAMTFPVSSTFKQKTTIYQIFQQADLKCVAGRKGLQFCTTCDDSQSVLCSQEDCECLEKHENCYVQKIKAIEKYISKKIVQSDCSLEIKEKVKKIVDQVSSMQKVLLQHFDSKLFGLTQIDRDFLFKVKNYSTDKKVPGQSIPEYKKRSESEKNRKFQQEMLGQLKLVKKAQDNCNLIFQSIKQTIIEEYKIQNYSKQFLNNSEILEERKEKLKIAVYFSHIPAQIISCNKIYSANQHGWTSQAFNQMCENKSNLLYLVENEFGKKYGGYSPCQLSFKRAKKWQCDQSLTSFIFSLDANLKSKLTEPAKAINNSGKFKDLSWFVSFGSSQNCNLFISELSNKKKKENWINFSGGAYEKKQYQIMEVSGTDIDVCKLRAFQVFEIKFGE